MESALAAERTAHARAIQNRDTIIADLRLQLHGHKKHRFGSKSESSAQLALELILEELEIEQGAETEGDDEDETSSETDAPKPPRTPHTAHTAQTQAVSKRPQAGQEDPHAQ